MKKKIVMKAGLGLLFLYLFLLSIKLMSSGFKIFGSDLAEMLLSISANPIIGLFIGILATSVIQSSSATTSILIGFTAAGQISIVQVVPMIMGANIGTSVTNTIVSLAHVRKKEELKRAFEVATVHDFFNIVAVMILLPIEIIFHPIAWVAENLTTKVFGSIAAQAVLNPLNLILNPVNSAIEGSVGNPYIFIILGLIGIFVSLHYFVNIIKPLAQSEFKHKVNEHVFDHPWRSFLFGLGLTVLVQSSSVTTSLIVPLAGVGIFSLRKVFPYIIGANIGTTITSFLAAIVLGTPIAMMLAIAHLCFNVLGAAVVYPIKIIPIRLSRLLALCAYRYRMTTIFYVIIMFYIIPLLTIVIHQLIV